jgi:tetratricopeptide (TPR) repeat protein
VIGAARDLAAQTDAVGQGAPPIVPPRSSLRIGDTKRTTPTPAAPRPATVPPTNTSPSSSLSNGSLSNGGLPNHAAPQRSGATDAAASGTQSSSGAAYSTDEGISSGPGSRLEIRRPTALPPHPTLQPHSELPTRATTPTPASTSSTATSNTAISNTPTLRFQPAVTNPGAPMSTPAPSQPTYTASNAPLAPRAPLNPRASTPPNSADGDIAADGALPSGLPSALAPQLPPIQPSVEQPQLAAPGGTLPDAATPTASVPSAAAPSFGRPDVAAPTNDSLSNGTLPPIQDVEPKIVAAPSPARAAAPMVNEPAPAGTGSSREASPKSANDTAFQPPPLSTPVEFPPTRTITRLPPKPAAPMESEADLLSADPIPDPAEPGSLPKLEPVDFNGVLLGESTVDEVLKAWGAPARRTGTGNDLRLNYKIEPFESIDVTFFDSKAEAIVIELGERFPTSEIVKELSLNEADAVAVEDAAGQALGIVFPERGVSLRFEPGPTGPLVATIGLDRISARPFVLRAEKRLDRSYTAALTDLAIASNLDPKNTRALWIRARLLQKLGKSRGAMAAIENALKIDSKAADYLLMRAELLADEGFFDAAMADNEVVFEGTKALPLYQARSSCQRGTFLAEGVTPDFAEAIEAHTQAVRLAEPLTTDKNRNTRRGAKRLVVEAHLAIAQDIAWGEWRSKEAVVERWLTKAETLAIEGRKSGDLTIDALLDVYVRAATACVGTQGKGEPLAWAEKLKRTADEALADCDDPLRRRQIQFEAGLGFYDALQALHARGDIENALKFGTEAAEWIQQGRVGRDETPVDAYRFGRLYFRIGSLYAVKKHDHKTAVEWFDRAAPLLERPLADKAAGDRGRQGETLVSMGISYWAGGNRERALQLTSTGATYMQQAVRDGVLDPSAMGVAYSNLATMHKQLGDEATSTKFVEMASRVEASGGGVMRR